LPEKRRVWKLWRVAQGPSAVVIERGIRWHDQAVFDLPKRTSHIKSTPGF